MRHTGKRRRRHAQYTRTAGCIVQGLMSFRPARFTDISRSGPPTTRDGVEWSVRLSAPPPDEWLVLFQNDARGEEAASGARWPVKVEFVELRFASSPDNIPRAVEHIEQRIRRANDDYRSWLTEAHRKGDARRQGEAVEADRVRDLNERFKNL